MSMELMVRAMKTSVGNPLRKLVLLKLADNANDQGECWPSYQYIADQCEIGRSTVRKHIKDLNEQGLLKIENRLGGEKGNKSNVYILTLDPVSPDSTGVARDSIGVPPDSTPPVPPDSTRTSHSSEPVIEPNTPKSPEAKKSPYHKNPQSCADRCPTRKEQVMALNERGFTERGIKQWLPSLEKLMVIGLTLDQAANLVARRKQKKLAVLDSDILQANAKEGAAVGMSELETWQLVLSQGWCGFKRNYSIPGKQDNFGDANHARTFTTSKQPNARRKGVLGEWIERQQARNAQRESAPIDGTVVDEGNISLAKRLD